MHAITNMLRIKGCHVTIKGCHATIKANDVAVFPYVFGEQIK